MSIRVYSSLQFADFEILALVTVNACQIDGARSLTENFCELNAFETPYEHSIQL